MGHTFHNKRNELIILNPPILTAQYCIARGGVECYKVIKLDKKKKQKMVLSDEGVKVIVQRLPNQIYVAGRS